MKIKFITCVLLLLVSLSPLRGQTIEKKDLEGYWRFFTPAPKKAVRFMHYNENATFEIYIDTLTNAPFYKGRYSIRKVQGETILTEYTNFFFVSDSDRYIIRRTSPDTFEFQSAFFTKSGELKKWNDSVNKYRKILYRVDIKKIKTKII